MSSRDDIFLVRASSIPAVGESNQERGILNRMGAQIVTDLLTQMILSGYAYHMQGGTEDAGIAATVAIDDQLCTMLADNSAGNAMIPLLYEVNIGVLAAATIVTAMLEIDKDKIRYDSTGNAFVPANLRTDDPNSANGNFYVGPDVTLAAKSAIPNSVELARKDYIEDALADSLGYPGTWATKVYDIATRPAVVLIDESSFIGHCGSASANDTTGYYVLQFAQFDKNLVI
jgi:hypothetical protein